MFHATPQEWGENIVHPFLAAKGPLFSQRKRAYWCSCSFVHRANTIASLSKKASLRVDLCTNTPSINRKNGGSDTNNPDYGEMIEKLCVVSKK